MIRDGTPSVPNAVGTPTPQQRERAVTIFERSVAGRRAGTLPPLDVPEIPLEPSQKFRQVVSLVGRATAPR